MAEHIHPFSPITSQERLNEAVEYVAGKTLLLAKTVIGRELPIDTICFFAQTAREYAFLEKAVRSCGEESRFSHDPTVYVDTDFTVANQYIKIFGVRKPDPTRPWVGYGDYPLAEDDYIAIRDTPNAFIQEIASGKGQSLLQFKHPNFDVLGFAFRAGEHD